MAERLTTGLGRTITDQFDAQTSGIDKRKYKRKTVLWSGKLSLLWGARLMGDEQTVPGVVRDMSTAEAIESAREDERHPSERDPDPPAER